MSMHKKPLTAIEEAGLIAHGFGRDIGKPSMAADIFRHGVAWGQMSELDKIKSIQKQIDHGMPFQDNLRNRLTELLAALISLTQAQHSDDIAVDRFAEAMKAKLDKKRDQGRGGWETAKPEYLSQLLLDHVAKGDPVDVANFCMMLHNLGSGISQCGRKPDGVVKPFAWMQLVNGEPIRSVALFEREKQGMSDNIKTLYPDLKISWIELFTPPLFLQSQVQQEPVGDKT